MCLIVIPARYGSTRFPGKPLVKINNKPMIIHVYERACSSKFAKKVLIATDDERILDTAKRFNAEAVLTSDNISSGTDRVYEVAKGYDYNIVVNVQGDEPFINPEVIDNAVVELKNDNSAHITTPVKKIDDLNDIDNPNVVKVVFNKENFAIYFSRSRIPYNRDKNEACEYYKHIGLYCYRKSALEKFVNLSISRLEKIEKLEQLRAIEANMKIKIFLTDYNSIGIDTPADLEHLKALIKDKKLFP
jgi:3-deoxy-manno-octulosonate cytidylyltransferase (CMP-KDO synthetase)